LEPHFIVSVFVLAALPDTDYFFSSGNSR
jgi:hypothetical protein